MSTPDQTTEIWYSEAIEKVRVCSDPGGDAFSTKNAKELRDELDAAIQKAEGDR